MSVCFDKAVIIRPRAPPPGRQTQKGWALKWGSNAFGVAPPNGTSPRGTHAPRRGQPTKKSGAADNCTPHKTSFPGGNANTFQPSYKPYKPSYKPSYKPCMAPKEFVQTVQTVHQGGLLSNTPNRNGLYGLYDFPKRGARFV